VADASLLVIREATERRGAGTWSCPGGLVEFEQTLESAVREELLSEAGLDAAKLPPLTLFDFRRTFSHRPNPNGVIYSECTALFHVHLDARIDPATLTPRDASHVTWVRLADVASVLSSTEESPTLAGLPNGGRLRNAAWLRNDLRAAANAGLNQFARFSAQQAENANDRLLAAEMAQLTVEPDARGNQSPNDAGSVELPLVPPSTQLPPCWHGFGCRRQKNDPKHCAQFSHPCPDGATCWRRNVRHRTQFTHATGRDLQVPAPRAPGM